MADLTNMRRSLLEAFRAWPETKDAFKFTFDFEKNSEGMKDIEPALSDLPALAVFPSVVSPNWWVAGIQQWPYALQATVWTRDWYLPPAEKLVRYLVNAAFRAKPSGSECTIIETANAKLARVENISFERVLISGDTVKAIRSTVDFVLTSNYSPFGS